LTGLGRWIKTASPAWTANKVLIGLIAFLSITAWVPAACSLSQNTDPAANETTRPLAAIMEQAAQGGNLHYQNMVLPVNGTIIFNSSQGYLCRAAADGSNPEILLKETGGNFANDQERLFYTEESQAGALAKMNFDGSSPVRIRQSAIKYLICSQDWLYAIEVTTGMPVRMKKDGSNRTLLTDHQAVALALSAQKLYICCGDYQAGLMVINLATDESEQLLDYKISSLNVAGQWLYYSLPADNYRLHAWSLELKKDTLISQFGIDKPFIVSEGFLYFIYAEEQNRLYRLPVSQDLGLELDQAELVIDDLVDSFVVCGPYIYYQRPASQRIYRVSAKDLQKCRIT
jgi:hypothetical protein